MSSVRSAHHSSTARIGGRVDRVYRDLREAIIDARFAPGSPLRLAELSEAYGVSLIPIREALRRLEVERLVETATNRGARVAAISLSDLEDAYATRVVLEIEALRRAWTAIDGELVIHLRRTRDRLLQAQAAGEGHRVAVSHRDLHFGLYERSGSDWLLHLTDILWSHTERYRRLAFRLRTSTSPREDLHGRVLDAIEAGDPPAAEQALREDLEGTARLIAAEYEGMGALGGDDPRTDDSLRR